MEKLCDCVESQISPWVRAVAIDGYCHSLRTYSERFVSPLLAGVPDKYVWRTRLPSYKGTDGICKQLKQTLKSGGKTEKSVYLSIYITIMCTKM